MSSSENFAARLALKSARADQGVPLRERLATLRHLKRLFAQIWRTSPLLPVALVSLAVVMPTIVLA